MANAKEITSRLWEMANQLRGTMDASEYKNYILPFMFYRYLSENQDDYLKANQLEEFYEVEDTEEIEDYLEEISRGIGYAIEPEYTWASIVSKIESYKIIASDFQDMFEAFNKNAKRNASAEADFANVFSDVNLGDTRLGSSTNERAKALNDIVLMVSEFTFKDDRGRDILGDVYEYLIGQFAATAGKKGGEFYTPHEVSKVLAKIVTSDIINTDEQFRVYDPTMGSGSLLLTVQNELPHGDEEGSVEFYGQERNTTTYNLARMNLMMHGVNYRNMELRCADTLDADWPFDERNGTQIPVQFDAVVANPPYSQKWDIKTIDREKDSRFKGFGVAPASKADYAFVLHSLYHLNKNGTMAIVLPHGVLFRGAAEGRIRKNLIDNNLLDTVIGLPVDKVIDCLKEKLSDEHINKIIETYKKRETIDKYSYVANLDEIKNENEYNLNIPRYVDTFEEEEAIPLPDLANDLVAVSNEIKESQNALFELLAELDGTTDEAKEELSKFIDILAEN